MNSSVASRAGLPPSAQISPSVEAAAVSFKQEQDFDSLCNLFVKFEIPRGMVFKLLSLSGFRLHFIIDDSGSMTYDSDALDDRGKRMTRWKEVQARLLKMFEVLQWIPTQGIIMTFMNRPDVVEFQDIRSSNHQAFLADAVSKINTVFQRGPSGSTPTLQTLRAAFGRAGDSPTTFYLFTDGVPNGGPSAVAQFVQTRANPHRFPLTFCSCTDQDGEAEWMKEVEEKALACAELDDYLSEKREVEKDQGKAFPYSWGMWLICNLCAALHPDDLDALDENVPLTKACFDNLVGYITDDSEYDAYFSHHKAKWWQYKSEFFTARCAGDISAVKTYRSSHGCVETSRGVTSDTAGVSIPNEFLCPISLGLMDDPVMAQDGATYEREDITRWLSVRCVSPLTNLPISPQLTPNRALKDAIERFKSQHGIVTPPRHVHHLPSLTAGNGMDAGVLLVLLVVFFLLFLNFRF
jgi:hypothetical protein